MAFATGAFELEPGTISKGLAARGLLVASNPPPLCSTLVKCQRLVERKDIVQWLFQVSLEGVCRDYL